MPYQKYVYIPCELTWDYIKPELEGMFAGEFWINPIVVQHHTLEYATSEKDIALVLKTSGSTGSSKYINLSRRALIASYDMVEDYFGRPKQVNWLLTLMPDRIAGMSVLVRSYLSGSEPTIMKDLSTFNAHSFVEAVSRMPEGGHRRVSLVPTQLMRILENSAATKALQSFDAVLVGGGAVWAEILKKAKAKKINIVQTYGMTETCGGCVYNGTALKGVDVSIEPDGHIALAGPMLANQLGDNFTEVEKYVTEDKGYLEPDGALKVLGRADDVIISGGVKISAHDVAEKLKEVPGISDAFVVGAYDPEWGQRLIAFTVGTADEAAIRQYVSVLGRAAMPKKIEQVQEIPYMSNGKPDRQKLLNCYTKTMSKPTLAQWVEGARLRTFPLSLAPIIAGSAVAYYQMRFSPILAALCFLVALLLQIGVNYSNDYSDGIRGTDDNRVGPLRLTGSGVATPEQVKKAAYLSFALACLCGFVIVMISQHWWLLLVGIVAVGAAWGYTGGKQPYGYMGLGELFVFIFFGLVATLGTEYVQTNQITFTGFIAAVSVGSFACAVLVANNLRDIETDAEVGKNTLAVRMGDTGTRIFYLVLMLLPFALLGSFILRAPLTLLGLVALLFIIQPVKTVMSGTTGPQLIPVLKQTGIASLAYTLLFGFGLVLSWR